jgi:hypothetical protein
VTRPPFGAWSWCRGTWRDSAVRDEDAVGDAYNSSTDGSSRRGSTDGPSRRRSTGRRLKQQHWRRFRAAALTAPREEEARATVSSSGTDGSSRRRSTGDGSSSSTDGSPRKRGTGDAQDGIDPAPPSFRPPQDMQDVSTLISFFSPRTAGCPGASSRFLREEAPGHCRCLFLREEAPGQPAVRGVEEANQRRNIHHRLIGSHNPRLILSMFLRIFSFSGSRGKSPRRNVRREGGCS